MDHHLVLFMLLICYVHEKLFIFICLFWLFFNLLFGWQEKLLTRSHRIHQNINLLTHVQGYFLLLGTFFWVPNVLLAFLFFFLALLCLRGLLWRRTGWLWLFGLTLPENIFITHIFKVVQFLTFLHIHIIIMFFLVRLFLFWWLLLYGFWCRFMQKFRDSLCLFSDLLDPCLIFCFGDHLQILARINGINIHAIPDRVGVKSSLFIENLPSVDKMEGLHGDAQQGTDLLNDSIHEGVSC